MKVSLIDFTGKGLDEDHGSPTSAAHYAAAVLAFTKGTRLQMTAGGLEDFLNKTYGDLIHELEYMANTIPSSWEFVDMTFMVEGVTRAFTHQFVRSRHWSFAQQTMRVLNVSDGPGWTYLNGPTVSGQKADPNITGADLRKAIYDEAMQDTATAYKSLIANGAAVEDARGVLPTNILTNIVGKCNLRGFVELTRKRRSVRTQGEYRDVLDAMHAAVEEVYPWINLFTDRTADKAIQDLEDFLQRIKGRIQNDEFTDMVKRLDQLRALV